MYEQATLARPYAQAVFQQAHESGMLGPWSEMLGFLGLMMAEPLMRATARDPRVGRERLERIIFDVAEGRLSPEGANLVRVLLDASRVEILPEIARLYEQLRAEAEGVVEVEIISAYPLEEQEAAALGSAVRRRMGKELTLKTRVDRGLIGGAVVRIGDLVIDGSLRGRLQQLSTVFG